MRAKRTATVLRVMEPTIEATYSAFWSYVRKDNKNDGGRILNLADDISREYELLSGDDLNIFRDVQDINWGEDWVDKISQALAGIAFLIPVLTPAYFKSGPCRDELQEFVNSAERLGLEELILPILYIDVPSLHDDNPQDPLVKIVKKYNWVDWQKTRLTDRNSAEYRQAVHTLAQRLVKANRRAEELGLSTEVIVVTAEDVIEEPGSLEKIAETEEILSEIADKITHMGDLIDQVSEAVGPVEADIARADKSPKPMAARLSVLKKLAIQLQPISADMVAAGRDFANDLRGMDAGMQELFVASDTEAESDPEAVRTFLQSIVDLADSAQDGLGTLKAMAESIQPIEGLSRDLRRPLRNLRSGLMVAHDGLPIMLRWRDAAKEILTNLDGKSEQDS